VPGVTVRTRGTGYGGAALTSYDLQLALRSCNYFVEEIRGRAPVNRVLGFGFLCLVFAAASDLVQ